MNEYINRLYKIISSDIGIDLGTANTLVYVRGNGIVIREPSVVALNKKTGRVVAVGEAAKKMLGRTPAHIEAVRPLVGGVVSDFEVTEEMLAHLISRVRKLSRNVIGPRVLIGVPSNVTNVQIRAVRDAAKSAGAREVHVIEEPMAAAIGIKLPVKEAVGSMIIDIGGGTSDIAVISLGGIVCAQSLQTAGDSLNKDIISYIRDEFKILIGDQTAEQTKIVLGSLEENTTAMETIVKGRDLVTGLPKEVVVTQEDIKEALRAAVSHLVDSTKSVLENTPPELLSDIMRRGIILVGGGALIPGLRELLETELNIPVHIADDPLTSVARGTGIVLENFDIFKEVLIDEDHAFPPK